MIRRARIRKGVGRLPGEVHLRTREWMRRGRERGREKKRKGEKEETENEKGMRK